MPEILEVRRGSRCPYCLDETPSLHVHVWYRDRNTGHSRGDYDGVHYDLDRGRLSFEEFFRERAEREPDVEPMDKHLHPAPPVAPDARWARGTGNEDTIG